MDSKEIYSAVTEHYSALSSGAAVQENGAYGKSVAQSFGYTEDELASIPIESNLGLSCGNPLAIASLREGETIVDLGSGAGFDVFLAACKVGPTGRAIGVDMNKDMLSLAEKNKAKSGADNVDFVEGRITGVPLQGGIADAIISNCVINLVPEDEKHLVFHEIFRLLKSGGRVAISDILAEKPLSEGLKRSVAAYVGCVAGASLAGQYEKHLKAAGFADVLVIKDANSDLNVYIDTPPDGSRRARDTESEEDREKPTCCTMEKTGGCCEPRSSNVGCCGAPEEKWDDHDVDVKKAADKLRDIDLNEWVGSYKIFAVKP